MYPCSSRSPEIDRKSQLLQTAAISSFSSQPVHNPLMQLSLCRRSNYAPSLPSSTNSLASAQTPSRNSLGSRALLGGVSPFLLAAPPHSLALSATVPTFSFPPYFSRTLSLWYFQNCLDASLPATRLRILAPPGWSSRKSAPAVSFHLLHFDLTSTSARTEAANLAGEMRREAETVKKEKQKESKAQDINVLATS